MSLAYRSRRESFAVLSVSMSKFVESKMMIGVVHGGALASRTLNHFRLARLAPGRRLFSAPASSPSLPSVHTTTHWHGL